MRTTCKGVRTARKRVLATRKECCQHAGSAIRHSASAARTHANPSPAACESRARGCRWHAEHGRRTVNGCCAHAWRSPAVAASVTETPRRAGAQVLEKRRWASLRAEVRGCRATGGAPQLRLRRAWPGIPRASSLREMRRAGEKHCSSQRNAAIRVDPGYQYVLFRPSARSNPTRSDSESRSSRTVGLATAASVSVSV